MEIYDKDGRLIGHVNPVHISKTPLEETRQAGDRKREEWLRDLPRRSAKENWDNKKACSMVEADIAASPYLGSGAVAAKSEGLLACHPTVRSDFDRLGRLRDEAWGRDRTFLRRVKHGPHQLLVDVLRRASRTRECQYVTNTDMYLTFMYNRYK
jgi:hypothetical protein